MKKNHYYFTVTALVFALMLIVATNVLASTSTPTPESIREKLREENKARLENIKANQDIRNNILEDRRNLAASTSSSTRPLPSARLNAPQARYSSSSEQFGRVERNDDRYENNGKAMREAVYKIRKENIIRQLTLAINNLEQVRNRISDRIAKVETSGRDMTNAKALLATADSKILLAKNAVKAINDLKAIATSTSTTGSSTPIIDLEKPRQLAQGAIQAIKDAQRSLNAVVVAIAHAMGFKVGQDGTIIVPTPTATPTPSPTPTITSTPSPTTSPFPTASVSPSPVTSASPSPSPSESVEPSPSI